MFSELNLVQGLTASQHLSPSLPFCLRFNVGFRHVPYTNAAKLDTEPVANSYSGGIRTRSSSSHFQSARAFHGSLDCSRYSRSKCFLLTASVADCECPRQTVLGDQATAQRFAFMLAPIDCRTAIAASATSDDSESLFLLAPNR